MKIIFIEHTGPLVTYSKDCLTIEDLNPQAKITWRVSRKELFVAGLRCMWAALTETGHIDETDRDRGKI